MVSSCALLSSMKISLLVCAHATMPKRQAAIARMRITGVSIVVNIVVIWADDMCLLIALSNQKVKKMA